MPVVIEAGSLDRMAAKTRPDVARFMLMINSADDREHHRDDDVHLAPGR